MAYEGTVKLEISSDRIAAGQAAGQDYTDELEKIRDDLDKAENTGTTLGTMVGATLEMTEAESRYQVKSGIPKKVSTSVKQAAGEVKKG
jgi:hypothetical protein